MPVSASQTIGPFWHLIHDGSWADLTRFGVAGAPITIEGRITDGAAAAVTDAAVELFQASPVGCDGFPGYGRAATDAAGWFRFVTIKPAARQVDLTTHAPQCGLAIMARGLLKPLFTRLYFDDEPANATDPILALIEPAGRRDTLIARREGEGAYRLDINLQGPQETVFLEF